jgi:tetratricopeptide (TPR) repeat protein
MNRRKRKSKPTPNAAPALSKRKLWYFRVAALVGVPLILFGVLELVLRLSGFGYSAAFLLKSVNQGEKTFVQNNQFGWRFFGPHASRQPCPISIPREKPAGTIRIFVFGESAAYGDPQPRFGLPRMLEAMLELRHPDKKFEVVNAAMTAINSHVIRPLARDCANADADVWVIYMGNNEVVGPFGAGTVFGNQTPPLFMIRAGLALEATRTGQLFEGLRRVTQRNSARVGAWEGMRMFVKHKVAGSDPRLAAVYENFEKNLEDIIAAGESSGAKVVLSTVAVNLKDCAPFASLHRTDLSEAQLNDWQLHFETGAKAQASSDFQKAAVEFEQAKLIDETFAELRFRRAQCALALSDLPKAQLEFAAARNLDALRFRCDTRLNEIIRQKAAGNVTLADAERAMAGVSPDRLPGADFFYEHVHLTFQGNYVLGRVIAEKVEAALSLPQSARWPAIAECAQRLGHTSRDIQLALSDMHGRLADVPFTFQFNHDEQVRRLTEMTRQLPLPNSPATVAEARAAVEAALARWPDDAVLWEQLGELKQEQGDDAGALAAAQRALGRLPSSTGCWLLKGILLAQGEKYEEAFAAFGQVVALDPQAVWARHNIALCLQKLDRRDEAVAEFKRTLALRPDYGTGWLALGQLYEEMGRTNDAQQCFDTALTNRVNQADDLTALARFCAMRGRFDLAATNYAAAVELRPLDPGLRLESGRALVALGRLEEALREYATAVELDSNQVQAHMQLGVTLGRLRKPDLAEKKFRDALRLDPNLVDARVNLGIALYHQQKFVEALHEFEDVLRRNPKDPNALRYVQLLQNRMSLPEGP